jgi:predicted nucleic acid-binding protein
MIAIDTSSLIAFLSGDPDRDVEAVDIALDQNQVVLPPVVLTEILSTPRLDKRVARLVKKIPVLELQHGYWERAGATRAKLLGKKLRARLADTLIAQSCIDHGAPLITRDTDFRHFAAHSALRLIEF